MDCVVNDEEKQLENLKMAVIQMNSSCSVLTSVRCKVEVDQILGIRAYELNNNVLSTWQHQSHDDHHHSHGAEDKDHPHHGLSNIILEHTGSVSSVSAVTQWLADLLWEKQKGAGDGDGGAPPMEIFRMKGIFSVDKVSEKYFLQAVCGLFEFDSSQEGSCAWADNEIRSCKVLVVGRRLDEAAIRNSFEAMLRQKSKI
eukprot:TRINITY_DN11650_c0_g1_i2.p1 TRINITY_DN11650_c0_g1~~TRINITY_DN11650_c0_g1_i2.p1  ORF type:complete len:199 (+),score=47.41 TRINITY_DN11650_c0_g1_i2:671-1267(+)